MKHYAPFAAVVVLVATALCGIVMIEESTSPDSTFAEIVDNNDGMMAENDIIGNFVAVQEEDGKQTDGLSGNTARELRVSILGEPKAKVTIDGKPIEGGYSVQAGTTVLAAVTLERDYRLVKLLVNDEAVALSEDEFESGTTLELEVETDIVINANVEYCYEQKTINISDYVKVSGDEIRYNTTIKATKIDVDDEDWGNFEVSDSDLAYHIEAKSVNLDSEPFRGEVEVSIYMGNEYNGTVATILHKSSMTNIVESHTAEVIDGYATVTVSDLSPFLVMPADLESSSIFLIVVVLAIALIAIGIACFLKFGRKNEGFVHE